MAITLFNPTDDDFKATYGGTTFTIPKCGQDGHMVRVDDAKGNHLLNQLGPRGLTSLDYGDSEEVKEKKAKDGKRRNYEFKRTQVARYNRDNEARKARQLEYVEPPDFIKEWSKDLGVGLVAPYEVADIKNEEIAQLREENKNRSKENDELRKQLSKLMDRFDSLMDKTVQENEETEDQKKIDTTISVIKKMNRQSFGPWVTDLKQQKYGAYPMEVQEFIREKWEGFFGDEKAFPY